MVKFEKKTCNNSNNVERIEKNYGKNKKCKIHITGW